MLEFKKISIEDKPIFDKYIALDQTNNSEGAFATLFIWDAYYNMEIADNGEFLFIRFNRKGKMPEYLYPIGKRDIEKAIFELKTFAAQRNEKLSFALVSKKNKDILKNLLGDNYEFTENRDSADYVYLTENMISLPGKKLHSKKNHYNYFVNKYNFEYVNITDEALLKKCAEKAYNLVSSKKKNKNSFELGAMKAYFDNYQKLSQTGAVLLVDGEIAAMSFGERLSDECALIQIELADESYRGAYQAINKMFCEYEWKDYKYVNREEDMGIDGIRRAKESYQPVYLAEKYFITEK